MNGVLHRLRSRPWIALVLACAGVLLRAAIPVGFMPAVSGQESGALIVCPGHAPMPPAADKQQGDDTRSERPAPCQFAFAAGTALPFAVPAFAAPLLPELPTVASIATWPRSTQPLRSHGARDPPGSLSV